MGAAVKCSMGTSTSYLLPDDVDWVELNINRLPEISVEATSIPNNMNPFGQCNRSGRTCEIEHRLKDEWKLGSPSFRAQGKKVLVTSSFLLCKRGGMIRIINSGQVPSFWESLLLSENLTEEHFVFLANLFLFDLNDTQRERFLQLLIRPSVAEDAHDPLSSPLPFQDGNHPFFTVDKGRAGAILSAMQGIVAEQEISYRAPYFQAPPLDERRATQFAGLFASFSTLGPYLLPAVGAETPNFTLKHGENDTLILEYYVRHNQEVRLYSLTANVPSITGEDRTVARDRVRDPEIGLVEEIIMTVITPSTAGVVGVIGGRQQAQEQSVRDNAFNRFVDQSGSWNVAIVVVERRDETSQRVYGFDLPVFTHPGTREDVDIPRLESYAKIFSGG